MGIKMEGCIRSRERGTIWELARLTRGEGILGGGNSTSRAGRCGRAAGWGVLGGCAIESSGEFKEGKRNGPICSLGVVYVSPPSVRM